MASSSSSRLSNITIKRFYSVAAKHEKGGDAKKGCHLKEAIKFAVEKHDKSKWRTVNAVACGIDLSMIPLPSQIVLKILRRKGHQSYLVGGCVRDLLLKRVPKDFDVITTANLKQIKDQFHRSVIVGQRFPVCVVNIKGQAIEVSSFETVANGGSMYKSNSRLVQKKSTKIDDLLWRNSMHRDFTVNSLFLDPFIARVYDYNGGMTDLKSLELRTLIPAHLSFQEDCARILRGLRIAARLNLSVSNDTATAIYHLSSSVLTLAKSRIMMEINYMLSYGAAQPSLCLLEQFNLLRFFFPWHAAILDQQTNEGCSLSSTMLMKLFSNLDSMVACDRPGHCSLWVSLMAFHLALNTKPQESLVIWTFSSLLCTKNWSRSVELARESTLRHAFSAPEISKSFDHMEDEELASKVSEFASLVATSIDSLTRERFLHESISRLKEAPSSLLVFVSEKCRRETGRLFSMFDADVKSYTTDKKKDEIDYQALKKGEVLETRFVLGQIIMDTLSGKVNKACVNSKPDEDMFTTKEAYTEELVDHNLCRNPSDHATGTPANENDKFNDYLTKPSRSVLESVEIVNSKTSPQNLDDYFLEELGPSCTRAESEERMAVTKTDTKENIVNQKQSAVAKTYLKENIEKQKRSGAHDQVIERLSEQEPYNLSQNMAADKAVQQKRINVRQVIETLQLQTEIKFPDHSSKKGNRTEVKMEIPRKDIGDTKQTAKETINRNPLSSLFKTMTTAKQNISKKIVGIFNGDHQGPSYQIKDVTATTSEKRTSESFRNDADCSIVETVECFSRSSSIGRTCQTKTTRRENESGKLQDETESLISILGGKHFKAMKNQEISGTLSQVIKEKPLKDEKCMHEVCTDEMRDATDGDNLQSGCFSDQKIDSLKGKLVETQSKSHEKSKTGFSITNREIAPSVYDDTKKLHINSRCRKNEDASESLEAGQENATSKQNLSNTKPGRRTSQKLKNLVETSDEIKKELDEEMKETAESNHQHQISATKKRKTSQRQSKLKDEANAVTEVNNNEALDADITEALGEIKSQKDDENSNKTAKTGVTQTASKPKKRRTVSKMHGTADISSEEIHEKSHNELSGGIQEQATTKKKRKPRKTQSKSKDEVNDQPATMQLKTAIEFTDDHTHADTNTTNN